MNPLEIQRPQDIHQSDKESILEYIKFAEEENFDGMQSIIYNSDGIQKQELVGKCAVKDLYNGFVECFNQEENHNKKEVLDKLSTHISNYNASISNIKVVGTYNNTKKYQKNNMVYYNGDSYFIISSPPTGTLPTNTTYFLKLGLKGDKGSASLGITPKGKWNASTQYNQYDYVIYDNTLYVSKTTNTNKIPSQNTSDWYIAVDYNDSVIELKESKPSYNTKGSLWMEII